MDMLVCEMCQSNDLVKKDGVYVCQHCGTKYTVEEARKLLVEGKMDVSGSTITIDRSAELERYLQNARRAKQKEDWEETEKYYNFVEQNDPKNIEALFYSAYGKACASLTNDDIYKRQAIFKALCNSVSMIDDKYDINSQEDRTLIEMISSDIIALGESSFVYTEKKDGYGISSDNRHMTYNLFISLNLVFITTLQNIISKYPDDKKAETLGLLQRILKHYDFLSNRIISHNEKQRQQYMTKAYEYHKKIRALDPSHNVPDIPTMIEKENSSTKTALGCIIFVIIAIFVIIMVFVLGDFF